MGQDTRPKAVLITGAAGSLGSALSLEAARRGFAVALLDRDQDRLERVYDRIVAEGRPQPVMQTVDFVGAGPDDYRQLLDAVDREFGGLWALVHCAAHFDCLTPNEHVPPNEWLLAIQVNLNAAWLFSVLALPMLRRDGGGRLYFMLEDLPRVGGALWGPYGVSKHALRALVGQLAQECQTSGVQVLGINPGPLRSALRARAYLAESVEATAAPAGAASRIVDLIDGSRSPSGVCVDLAAD